MLAKQIEDGDTKRVKSWLNVYFQEVHQAVVQNKWVTNVGKVNWGQGNKKGKELAKSLFLKGASSNSPS
jgi:hypothetical protein